ncbi:hypothetical protein [Erythrobacter sp. F6033]|uniref:hypothetical protein n=1 Tax=Erythrobacter sp. F6033 TaxID=2926401 RepID=UPI001FF2902B|nr:hypothetical protein [Erythrobacter sp. F6033]MCK0129127.1 hypothetical protein [Erythrobacter sp. F6033]
MSKAARISQRIDQLETEYRASLVAALSECSEGRWGLFGQNEHLGNRMQNERLDGLRGLADIINSLRKRIGDAPYPLHEEFESARGRGDPHQIGEPKLAEYWLARLEVE